MTTLSAHAPIPVYPLEPDESTGNKHFRITTFRGNYPNQSELLIPHRKSHYLIVFVKRARTRQWIDSQPYLLKDNTIYFTGPSQVIVKEEFKQLWSTGISFTPEFLSFPGNASPDKLPLIQNPHAKHELPLTDNDVLFVEDILDKIRIEAHAPGEWQHRMLTSYLTLLLTHLSRLYTEQFKGEVVSGEKLLLKKFQAKIDECFRDIHEVADYASLLHISAGHLSEVVKTQSGKPAIKHIHDRLIMESRRLLFHTDKALKDISFTLGFSDASYFNRFFKRETGATPSDYRAGIRKMYH